MTRTALLKSSLLSCRGFSLENDIPSLVSPATVVFDNSGCGVVPLAIAWKGRWRSLASLLNYAAAITLLAAPCSQTKTTVGRGLCVGVVCDGAAPIRTAARTPVPRTPNRCVQLKPDRLIDA